MRHDCPPEDFPAPHRFQPPVAQRTRADSFYLSRCGFDSRPGVQTLRCPPTLNPKAPTRRITMSLAQPPSHESVPTTMATRRLVASLNTWLEDQDPSAPRCDPDKLYQVARQTIEQLGPDAKPQLPPATGQEELVRPWPANRRPDPGEPLQEMAHQTGTKPRASSPRHGDRVQRGPKDHAQRRPRP